MPVQSGSVRIPDHYTHAVSEPVSILFASLQRVGGLLASMQEARLGWKGFRSIVRRLNLITQPLEMTASG